MSEADNSYPDRGLEHHPVRKVLPLRHVLTKGLCGHSDELFRRRPYAAGERVLDVGCGSATPGEASPNR